LDLLFKTAEDMAVMLEVELAEHCLHAENCGKGVYCLSFWALTCAIILELWSDFSKDHPKITNQILLPTLESGIDVAP
jgi:hypothetical protein